MIEVQRQQEKVASIESVLDCLKRREINLEFTRYLYAFIKKNPSKQEVEEVGTAFLKSKKQGLHFRETTDLLVTILKLLLNFAQNEQEQGLDERFNEKFQLFKSKINKSDVNEWIFTLKQQLIRSSIHKGEETERKRLRELFKNQNSLTKNFEKIIAERNQITRTLKKIAEQFFDFSEVQKNTGQPDFNDSVVACVKNIKESLKEKEEQAKVFRYISEKIKQMGKRHNLKAAESQQTLDQLDLQIKELNAKLSFSNKRIEAFKSIQIEKEQRIASLRIKMQKYDEEKKTLKSKMQELQAKQQEMICKNFLSSSQIILSHNVQQINFVRTSIKEITNIEGSKCKLLYTSSQPKIRNFHQFIDNKPNILLIVQLKNGIIIGAFSRQAFRPRCSGEYGFIFNVSHLQAYERQQRSTISYDDYYLIFGNSQICIKVNDMHILSNFGIQSRHFNSRNRDVSFFLGSSTREVEMNAYQIYEVLQE